MEVTVGVGVAEPPGNSRSSSPHPANTRSTTDTLISLRMTSTPSLVQVPAPIAEDPASYDQQVDLLGSLENIVDLGIAHPFFGQ